MASTTKRRRVQRSPSIDDDEAMDAEFEADQNIHVRATEDHPRVKRYRAYVATLKPSLVEEIRKRELEFNAARDVQYGMSATLAGFELKDGRQTIAYGNVLARGLKLRDLEKTGIFKEVRWINQRKREFAAISAPKYWAFVAGVFAR